MKLKLSILSDLDGHFGFLQLCFEGGGKLNEYEVYKG